MSNPNECTRCHKIETGCDGTCSQCELWIRSGMDLTDDLPRKHVSSSYRARTKHLPIQRSEYIKLEKGITGTWNE